MARFTVIPQDTFDDLQVDAGVLLRTFNPASPAAPADADIICATTGGINPTCVPTYSDYGEDIDNVPNNMMELKHLDGWECKLSTTALATSPEAIKLSLGAADIVGATYSLTQDSSIQSGKIYYTRSGTSPNYIYTAVATPSESSLSTYYEMTSAGNKVVPRRKLNQTDFMDSLWWVGDKADGGLVAIELKHALSTGGFSLQTTKNGKGQLALEITGHVSINDQDTMPMVFYSMPGEE